MPSKHRIGNNSETLTTSPEYKPYSKVVINLGEDEEGNVLVYEAGDDSGQTLETSMQLIAPFRKNQTVPAAGQEMAQRILNQIKGYRYQPYEATNALIPDTAELGDGLRVGGIYSTIASQDLDIDLMPTSDVSAPDENEIDNEFGDDYITREQRELARKINKIASSFTLSARRIEAKLEGVDGQLNSITQTLDEQGGSIEMVVSNGRIKASAIISAINGESSATINADRINLTAQVIKNTGVMTWSNVSDKPADLVYTSDLNRYVTDDELAEYVLEDDLDERIYTTIDDMSVTAERLRGSQVELIVPYGRNRYYTAGRLELDGASSYSGRKIVMSSGAIELEAVYGAIYFNAEQYVGTSCELEIGGDCIPSSNNRYNCGTSAFRWNAIWQSSGSITGSDRRIKTDINSLEDDGKYEDFFHELKPSTYKYINGTSGRFHLGFIANDVEEALSKSNLSTTDFAGFIRDKDENDEETLALRYDEFIALNTHMIQKLERRIAALETKWEVTNVDCSKGDQ